MLQFHVAETPPETPSRMPVRAACAGIEHRIDMDT